MTPLAPRPGWLDRLALAALPQHVHQDVELVRRARLLVGACAFLAAAAAFFVVVAIRQEVLVKSGIPIIVGILAVGANPFLLRRTGRMALPGSLFCFEIIAVMGVLAWNGLGVHGVALWWNAAVPLLGTFLVGPVLGVATLVAIACEFLFLLGMQQNGHVFMVPQAIHALNAVTSGVGSVAFITWMASLYERSKSHALNVAQASLLEMAQLRDQAEAAEQRVRQRADGQARLLEQLRRSTVLQDGAMAGTRQAHGRLQAAVESVGGTVVALGQAGHLLQDATHTLRQAGQDVSRRTLELEGAASAGLGLAQDMEKSARAVLESVESLRSSTGDVDQGVEVLGRAMARVEDAAAQSQASTAKVIASVHDGVKSVETSLAQVDAMVEATAGAQQAIQALSQRVQGIVGMLDVIDDVSRQTNLLALNAGIIASQSGESGRAFAVVADEIKRLSERTSTSTREIALLVEALRARAQDAVNVVETGRAAVESGGGATRAAGQALRDILDGASGSSAAVKAIVAAAADQKQALHAAVSSVRQISSGVDRVALAAKAQAQHGSQARAAAQSLQATASGVGGAAQGTGEAANQVDGAARRVHAMVTSLQSAQAEQERVAQELQTALGGMRMGQQAQARAVGALDGRNS